MVAPEWLAPTGAVCVPKICSASDARHRLQHLPKCHRVHHRGLSQSHETPFPCVSMKADSETPDFHRKLCVNFSEKVERVFSNDQKSMHSIVQPTFMSKQSRRKSTF